MAGKGWGILAVGVVAAAVIGSQMHSGSSPSTGSPSSTSNLPWSGESVDQQRYDAFVACQHFVNERLKAPSTASYRDWFGDQKPAVSGSGRGPYTVVSTVDSQNSFGAQLRSDFLCVVTRDASDTWHSRRVVVG
ncbi:MAG TPA: hypothetical protein VFB19_18680 [Mycobacterium sp.]|nr:hypothetical protein [Mycobacterium sp.]